MEQTLTLTRIDRYTTDKEGKPLIAQSGPNKGNPYESVRIKAEQHGDRMLSGFGGAWNRDWKVGDKVTVMVTESDKQDATGQPYLNFSKVDKGAQLAGDVSLIQAFIRETIIPALKDHNRRIKALEPVSENAEKVLVGDELLDYPERDDEVAF